MRSPTAPDKRKFNRAGAAFAARYSVVSPFEERINFGEKERDAIANDLCEDGVSLSTDYPVPVGTEILLKFRLLSGKIGLSDEERSRKFQAQGEVRNSIRGKDRSYRIGIRFTGLSGSDRDFIAGIL